MARKSFDVDGRRGFIKGASAFALLSAALPPVAACVQGAPAGEAGGAGRASRIEVAGRGEPGARLVMRGVVYGADEKPAPGVKIFLYQTDATALYSSRART